MAEEVQIQEAGKGPNKRKSGHKKGSKSKKKMKMFQGSGEKVKIDGKMKKLFRKRARDYDSDGDEEEPAPVMKYKKEPSQDKNVVDGDKSSDEGGEHLVDAGEENEVSDDEDGQIQPGITKFTEGCKAFKIAFKKITKKSVSDDVLGPVLSAHKKLVAEKLAEEEVEGKVKGEAKKEKQMVREIGHVKPANFLDSHEKFLIGIATKGVVKLFNAVNKAQSSQKGLNPSRSKDAKVIQKRRKEAFLSALRKQPSGSTGASTGVNTSTWAAEGEGPAWAPLRDNYMLTNSKLKNWDKLPETREADDVGPLTDSSSDDDD